MEGDRHFKDISNEKSKNGQMLILSYFPSTTHSLVKLLLNLAVVKLPAENIHGTSLSFTAILG